MTGKLKRSIGLTGTVAIIVGYVVGASIYILPGELASSAGPLVFLSFMLAAIPALLSCVITSQVVGMFPVSGANFVLVGRSLSRFWGFMMVWALLATIVVGMPLLAYGFADYLSFFVPNLPIKATAMGVILFFGVINYRGSRIALMFQELMVVTFLLALVVFACAGLFNLDLALIEPALPNGFGSLAIAAIPAYFSFTGFLAIAELGGEIENASTLVAKALKIAFVIILLIYAAVPLALTGTIPWSELAEVKAPIVASATRFLPGWLALLIGISALFAAATSINGVIMAQARDLFVASEDGLLPGWMGRIHPKFATPDRAVAVVTSLALLGTALGTSIKNYAIVTVMGFMMYQILVAVALLRAPKAVPNEWQKSPIKVSNFAHRLVSWSLIAISVLFVLAGLSQSLVSGGIYIGFLVMGVVYYRSVAS